MMSSVVHEQNVTTATTTRKTRMVGQGFGRGADGKPYHVPIYDEGAPKTGPILDLKLQTKFCSWLDADNDGRSIAEVVGVQATKSLLDTELQLCYALERIPLIVKLLEQWSPSAKQQLFSQENLVRLDPSLYQIIKDCRPDQLPNQLSPTALAEYYHPIISSTHFELRNDMLILGDYNIESLAIIIPGLLMNLSIDQWESVYREAGIILGKSFFAKYRDPCFNSIQVNPGQSVAADNILNNGRSLQVNASQTNLTDGWSLQWRGRTYYAVQLHFHRHATIEDDGSIQNRVVDKSGYTDAQLEFPVYRNKEHEQCCRAGLEADPNDELVGEMHAIFFSYDNQTGYRAALVIGTVVHIGEANLAFQSYLNEAVKVYPDGMMPTGSKIPLQNVLYDPLAVFGQPLLPNQCLSIALFASLQMGKITFRDFGDVRLTEDSSDTFYQGNPTACFPKPITISPDQLRTAQRLQLEFEALRPDLYIKPLAINPALPVEGCKVWI